MDYKKMDYKYSTWILMIHPYVNSTHAEFYLSKNLIIIIIENTNGKKYLLDWYIKYGQYTINQYDQDNNNNSYKLQLFNYIMDEEIIDIIKNTKICLYFFLI